MATCLIVGEGTMPVQCANALMKRNVVVRAVSCPDEPLQTWAAERNVANFRNINELTVFARSERFDYLFSIVNYRILPSSLLSLPKGLAINYHDSVLPRYAGVRATTWAIMNGETTHGITWHVMAEGIDTGDILKQVTFPINRHDSAYKLNLKCYYVAIAAFSELIGELAAGAAKAVKQDLSQRTYFAAAKRPDNDCLISFNWSADRIDFFCRALDFGSAPNVIGRPKVIIGGRLLMAPGVELAGSRSTAIPGTVVRIDADGFHVATSTEDVIVPKIYTLGGRALSLNELSQIGLAVGVGIEAASLLAVTCPEAP